jgi:glycerol-3-phosphate O-acyltransferase / dihydroxyacetone phosphate acyltransferase
MFVHLFRGEIQKVNHANQFMDAVMAVCGCENKVSYLMAEASWKRPIIGHIAWALDVVPVKRAQDEAKQGTGLIKLVPGKGKETSDDTSVLEIVGTDTVFTKELTPGDKIRPPKTPLGLKVTKILSDTSLLVEDHPDFSPSLLSDSVTFDILKRTPLNVVFARVLERLAAGGAVGVSTASHASPDVL